MVNPEGFSMISMSQSEGGRGKVTFSLRRQKPPLFGFPLPPFFFAGVPGIRDIKVI